MGQCTVAETREVQDMLQQHAEVRTELAEIEKLLFAYAQSHAEEPSSKVREELMRKIAQTATNVKEEARVIPMEPRSRNTWWLAAASIVLLISSVATNVVQYSRNNSLNGEIAQLRDRNSSLAGEMDVTKASYESSQKMFAIVNDTSTTVVPMLGTPAFPTMKATVYWNKKSDEVYLAVNNMAKPEEGKEYQLWAIVDGVPVDAGMLNLNDSTALHKMKSFSDAEAFAITLEKKGGSPVPTLELMIVAGNV